MNNEKLFQKRKKILGELLERLNSPMPGPKKIRPHVYFRTQWKNGDVYAYKLDHKAYKDYDFYGEYILYYKIEDYKSLNGLDYDIYSLIYFMYKCQDNKVCDEKSTKSGKNSQFRVDFN